MGQLYDPKVRAAQLKQMHMQDSPEPSGDEEEAEVQAVLDGELDDQGEEEDWIDEEDEEPVNEDEDEDEDEESRPLKRRALNKGKGKERDEGQAVTNQPRRARRGKKRLDRNWTEIHKNQNMYRRFDGSALMALGTYYRSLFRNTNLQLYG